MVLYHTTTDILNIRGISLTEATSPEQAIVLIDSTAEKSEQITAKPAENDVSKENIAPRKTIVYATVIDDAAIREASNRIKQQLFIRYGFQKPKPEEVQFASIEKYSSYTMRFTENTRLIIIASQPIRSQLTRQLEKSFY